MSDYPTSFDKDALLKCARGELFGEGKPDRFAEFDGPFGPERAEGPSLFDLVDASAGSELRDALRRIAETGKSSPISFSARLFDGDRGPETWAVHLRGVSGMVIVQLIPQRGWDAVDDVLREQQRFRSALLELSEQASTTEDDDEFYRRLIELAVEVVPGAQGLSLIHI